MDYQSALDKLRIRNTGLYSAGYPSYGRNFSRDSLVYGLLSSDEEALLAQIDYSAQHQGKNSNPDTGEEPGKIHHELPSGEWRGRPTAYNACDTTALFLMAVAVLAQNGDMDVLDVHKQNIEAAISYIQSHIANDLFVEDPRLCGSESFALRVTYWKDSVLAANREEPEYPVIYSLVHFQNARALQLIGKVIGNNDLVQRGDRMKKQGIEKLWRGDHFVTAIDNIDIDHPSSDSLHILLYLHPNELPDGYVQQIADYSKPLETEAGYVSGIINDVSDEYHTRNVWVFEQALLHAAAKKHAIDSVRVVSERIVNHFFDGFPELIDAKDNFKPAGNDPQLWSVGAHSYFNGRGGSLLEWL